MAALLKDAQAGGNQDGGDQTGDNCCSFGIRPSSNNPTPSMEDATATPRPRKKLTQR
jgi:hypothetical protein